MRIIVASRKRTIAISRRIFNFALIQSTIAATGTATIAAANSSITITRPIQASSRSTMIPIVSKPFVPVRSNLPNLGETHE